MLRGGHRLLLPRVGPRTARWQSLHSFIVCRLPSADPCLFRLPSSVLVLVLALSLRSAQHFPSPRRQGFVAIIDHENLDVYNRSIDFLALALRLIRRMPRGEHDLRDQLKRAAMSVPLNIAEGSGKPSAPDRARFFAIARGSAMECAALVDVCRVAGLGDAGEAAEAKQLLGRTIGMLSRLCRG